MARLIIVILGSAVVTFLPRFLPMFVLTRMQIPTVVIAWLRYVPVAVLAALIVPGIVTTNHQLHLSFSNAYLIASMLALFIAWRSKNMMLTVTVGMGTVLLLQTYFN